jgi:dUTP pyrophosphatase
VRIKKFSELARIPEYQTSNSSGFDLHSIEDTVLKIGEIKAISIGLGFQIPESFEIQIRPRSGLASRNGVVAIFGTIDSDYRGEIKVILANHGKKDFRISTGDRIAQGVIAPTGIPFGGFELVNDLETTKRGTNGFGSTGI